VKSSPARVLEEMLRMLESGAAKPFIELLQHHGLLYPLLPVLSHFIETEEEGLEIYSYLQEIDGFFQDKLLENLERPVLLSSLVFPLLQKRLQLHYLERETIPHLGQIQIQIRGLISDIFQEFLTLPRRLRYSMQNVLLGQYRLTPLHKKKTKRKRIPGDSDFHLALKFLALRACLEPGLKKIYEDWQQFYSTQKWPDEEKPRGRRRRPRRRKKTA